jgi:transcriptional regulator with XRE-family HTH domain
MPRAQKDRQKNPDLVAFGLAIRQRRKALGYSQEGFGDACGIDRSYMGGIERGEHNLALANILKIVQAMKITPSEFFRDLDPDRKFDLINEDKAVKDSAKLRKLAGVEPTAADSRPRKTL